MAEPMRQDINLDDCTMRCPCGSSLNFTGPGPQLSAWVAGHRAHCDGTLLEHTTADGNRAWGRPEPDRIVKLDDAFPAEAV